MIQRIQSIFLLLAVLVGSTLFLEPFNILSGPKSVGESFADGDLDVYDQPYLIGISAVAILLSLITMFLFRRRKIQLRLSVLSSILFLSLGVIGVIAYTQFAQEAIQFDIGNISILFSAVLCLIATRFIRKDDLLVKSMDRLR